MVPFLLFPDTSISGKVGLSLAIAVLSSLTVPCNAQREIVTLQPFVWDELIPHEKLQEMETLAMPFLSLLVPWLASSAPRMWWLGQHADTGSSGCALELPLHGLLLTVIL